MTEELILPNEPSISSSIEINESIDQDDVITIKLSKFDKLKDKFKFVKTAYNWLNKFKIIDIVCYLIILLLLFLVVLPSEKKDVFCPDMGYTKEKMNLCRDGNGGIYYYNRSSADDSIETSVEKVRKIIGNNKKLVKWRRCYLISLFASILLFLFVFKRFPGGLELLTSLFIMGSVFYISFNFYGLHHDDFVNTAIYENLNHIESEVDNYKIYPSVARNKINIPDNVLSFLDIGKDDKEGNEKEKKD